MAYILALLKLGKGPIREAIINTKKAKGTLSDAIKARYIATSMMCVNEKGNIYEKIMFKLIDPTIKIAKRTRNIFFLFFEFVNSNIKNEIEIITGIAILKNQQQIMHIIHIINNDIFF
jgi:hypothetical protein